MSWKIKITETEKANADALAEEFETETVHMLRCMLVYWHNWSNTPETAMRNNIAQASYDNPEKPHLRQVAKNKIKFALNKYSDAVDKGETPK